MLALPSKRAIYKVHPCTSCHFLAERQSLRRQPFSSSPSLAAKRPKVPRYRLRAEQRDPRPGLRNRDRGDNQPKRRDVKISPDFAKGLQELGFYSIPDVKNVLVDLYAEASKLPPSKAIQALATQQRFSSIAEQVLGSSETALIRDPAVLRKAMHLLGRNFSSENNNMLFQCHSALCMASLAGETDAEIEAVAAEMLLNYMGTIKSADGYGKRRQRLLPESFELVKKMALARSDWNAVSLYLLEMAEIPGNEETARQCYDLALELKDRSTPSKTTVSGLAFTALRMPRLQQPWEICFNAAQVYLSHLSEGTPEYDQVQRELENALRDGLYKYTDPAAIPFALNRPKILTKGSTEWVQFATVAASKAVESAAYELALYYLDKDGWRPKKGVKKATNWRGIEWLAVSAAGCVPNAYKMAMRYLAIAHLLHEHGYTAEGSAILEFAVFNVTEAGLDPSGEWATYFQHYKNSFEEAQKAQQAEYAEQFDSSDYFFESDLSEPVYRDRK